MRRIRLWVLPTPLDEDRITLNLATSAKAVDPRKIHPLLALIPGSLLTRLIRRFTFAGFINDVKQDGYPDLAA
ncbi:MAG TPA: hypothetical protein VK897_23320 [Anaerolineales bacterium]|nr:hypothetical protein [Anaerolineales bacterium]